MYFVVRNLLSRLDPDAASKEEARQKSIAANRKLKGILARQEEDDDDDEEQDTIKQRLHREELVLTPYEQSIAMEVVAPEEIPVSFEGIKKIWNPLARPAADTLSQTSEAWRTSSRS